MSNYPKIIIDETKNTPIDVIKDFSTEQYYDFMHHTHKMSDLIDDSEPVEIPTYDDTELRKDMDAALDDLFNKIMGITDEDSTTVDEAYDTLKEVSKYITEDGSAAAELINKVAAIEEAIKAKLDAVEGKSLVADSEIERLAGLVNYDDSEVRELIADNDDSICALTEKVIELETKKKFVINGVPEGTLVNYHDHEIRIMCPVDTAWTLHESVGETGNANMRYMAFKAYAPEGAVSFKEGDRGVIKDEMFTFEDKFAGTDEYGNYSICWLALASYNANDDVWTYFGKTSSTAKYIGWDYVVEWYDVDGKVMSVDSIRINLSNESCHLVNEPYYVGKIMAAIEELKK